MTDMESRFEYRYRVDVIQHGTLRRISSRVGFTGDKQRALDYADGAGDRNPEHHVWVMQQVVIDGEGRSWELIDTRKPVVTHEGA